MSCTYNFKKIIASTQSPPCTPRGAHLIVLPAPRSTALDAPPSHPPPGAQIDRSRPHRADSHNSKTPETHAAERRVLTCRAGRRARVRPHTRPRANARERFIFAASTARARIPRAHPSPSERAPSDASDVGGSFSRRHPRATFGYILREDTRDVHRSGRARG